MTTSEELSPFQREIIANGARIDLPLKGAGRMQIRELAEVMSRLGRMMNQASHDKDDLYQILLACHEAIREAKWSINKIRPSVRNNRKEMAQDLLRRNTM